MWEKPSCILGCCCCQLASSILYTAWLIQSDYQRIPIENVNCRPIDYNVTFCSYPLAIWHCACKYCVLFMHT
jgi:hypothetical protein